MAQRVQHTAAGLSTPLLPVVVPPTLRLRATNKDAGGGSDDDGTVARETAACHQTTTADEEDLPHAALEERIRHLSERFDVPASRLRGFFVRPRVVKLERVVRGGMHVVNTSASGGRLDDARCDGAEERAAAVVHPLQIVDFARSHDSLAPASMGRAGAHSISVGNEQSAAKHTRMSSASFGRHRSSRIEDRGEGKDEGEEPGAPAGGTGASVPEQDHVEIRINRTNFVGDDPLSAIALLHHLTSSVVTDTAASSLGKSNVGSDCVEERQQQLVEGGDGGDGDSGGNGGMHDGSGRSSVATLRLPRKSSSLNNKSAPSRMGSKTGDVDACQQVAGDESTPALFERRRLDRVYRTWDEEARRIRAEFFGVSSIGAAVRGSSGSNHGSSHSNQSNSSNRGTSSTAPAPAAAFASSQATIHAPHHHPTTPATTTTLLQTRLHDLKSQYEHSFRASRDMSTSLKILVKSIRYLTHSNNGVTDRSILAEREWHATYPLLWVEVVTLLDGWGKDLMERFRAMLEKERGDRALRHGNPVRSVDGDDGAGGAGATTEQQQQQQKRQEQRQRQRHYSIRGGAMVHPHGVEFDAFEDDDERGGGGGGGGATAGSGGRRDGGPSDDPTVDLIWARHCDGGGAADAAATSRGDVDEACRDWIRKVQRTPDLLCRIYGEVAVLHVAGTYMSNEDEAVEYLTSALSRIRRSLLGLAHPIVALYVRAYVVRWCRRFVAAGGGSTATASWCRRLRNDRSVLAAVRQAANGILSDHVLHGDAPLCTERFLADLRRVDLTRGDFVRIQAPGLRCMVAGVAACSSYGPRQIREAMGCCGSLTSGGGGGGQLSTPLRGARAEFWLLMEAFRTDGTGTGIGGKGAGGSIRALHEMLRCYHPSVFSHRVPDVVDAIRAAGTGFSPPVVTSTSTETVKTANLAPPPVAAQRGDGDEGDIMDGDEEDFFVGGSTVLERSEANAMNGALKEFVGPDLSSSAVTEYTVEEECPGVLSRKQIAAYGTLGLALQSTPSLLDDARAIFNLVMSHVEPCRHRHLSAYQSCAALWLGLVLRSGADGCDRLLRLLDEYVSFASSFRRTDGSSYRMVAMTCNLVMTARTEGVDDSYYSEFFDSIMTFSQRSIEGVNDPFYKLGLLQLCAGMSLHNNQSDSHKMLKSALLLIARFQFPRLDQSEQREWCEDRLVQSINSLLGLVANLKPCSVMLVRDVLDAISQLKSHVTDASLTTMYINVLGALSNLLCVDAELQELIISATAATIECISSAAAFDAISAPAFVDRMLAVLDWHDRLSAEFGAGITKMFHLASSEE